MALGFLDVTNPKAVLENALRNYACLTTGDVIAIHYNEHVYEISVLETKPGNAVSIIECDMNVHFAPPLGYTEDLVKKTDLAKEPAVVADTSRRTRTVAVPDAEAVAPDAVNNVQAFAGQGQRLDGKASGKIKTVVANEPTSGDTKPVVNGADPLLGRVGIPDYDFKIGTLHFMPGVKLDYSTQSDKEDGGNFSPFGGSGRKLRST